ncbi:MAG TPA: NAD(P)H-dependent oxidoreductase [Luteimonas sp.]|nr:NAD(P)H-dependent oxidoreductase [Luteimonas sp.]
MTDLLYIEASPRKQRSHSIAVAETFLHAYRQAKPEAVVDKLDLWQEPLPAMDGAILDAKYAILAKQPHTDVQRAAWGEIERAVARFDAADRLLFSVPMWNFNVPYVLKHYIDVVTQPTLTFSFSPEAGYRGLLQGKRALMVYASSGDYLPGTTNPRPDYQKPFVEAWLRFIGIHDIETVAVQPTIGNPDLLRATTDEAMRRVVELARDF